MLPGSAHLQEIRVLFCFGVVWVWLSEEYGKLNKSIDPSEYKIATFGVSRSGLCEVMTVDLESSS